MANRQKILPELMLHIDNSSSVADRRARESQRQPERARDSQRERGTASESEGQPARARDSQRTRDSQSKRTRDSKRARESQRARNSQRENEIGGRLGESVKETNSVRETRQRDRQDDIRVKHEREMAGKQTCSDPTQCVCF